MVFLFWKKKHKTLWLAYCPAVWEQVWETKVENQTELYMVYLHACVSERAYVEGQNQGMQVIRTLMAA